MKLYRAYGAKGFEIVAVSIDTNIEPGKQAMREDGMTWKSVWDKGSVVTSKYNIVGFHSNFLINEKGKIIGVDVMGQVLQIN